MTRPPVRGLALSAAAALLFLPALCLGPRPPVTVRVPRRVLVRIGRAARDGGTADRADGQLAVLERGESRLDDQCGRADLEAIVEFCDCDRRTADGPTLRHGCTVARVNYGLSLYARGRSTYFSATVDGDVVVENESGTAIVPGELLRRRTAVVFGPHRAGPDGDGDEDAIGDAELGEWLRREFADRSFGAAAADGVQGEPMPDRGCVDVPPNRTTDYRGLLPGAGCLRAFSEERCEGRAKMVFATAPESLLPRDGDDSAADPESEEPPFPVKSVTECGGRKSVGGARTAAVPAGDRPKCSCSCGSSSAEPEGATQRQHGSRADASTQTDLPEPIAGLSTGGAVQKDTAATEEASTDSAAKREAVSVATESLPAAGKADASTQTDLPEPVAGPSTGGAVQKDTAATEEASIATESLPAAGKASTQTDLPEPVAKTSRWKIVKDHFLTAKDGSPPGADVTAAAKPAVKILIVETAEPSPAGSGTGASARTDRPEPFVPVTEPWTGSLDGDVLTGNAGERPAATVPERSSSETGRAGDASSSAADDLPGGAKNGETAVTSFGEITTRIVEDAWKWMTMVVVAIGSFLRNARESVAVWSR